MTKSKQKRTRRPPDAGPWVVSGRVPLALRRAFHAAAVEDGVPMYARLTEIVELYLQRRTARLAREAQEKAVSAATGAGTGTGRG